MPPKSKSRSSNSGGTVVDLSGVEASSRRRKRVPEGDYLAVLKNAKVVPVKGGEYKGANRVSWLFVIKEGKQKGVPFYHSSMLVPDFLWNLRGTLQAMQPEVKIPDKAFDVEALIKKLLSGPERTVALSIVDDEYNGQPISSINDVFHPSLLEGDDDEGESDEDEDADDAGDYADEDDDESDDEPEDDEDEGDEEDDEESEDEDEEESDEEYTWEDVQGMSLDELEDLAGSMGVKFKVPKGKKLTKAAALRQLEPHFETGDDDEDVDLDEDEL